MSEKARLVGVTSGAISLGGFAAAIGLCCTLPWAVAIFGVTGAVAFARLAFLLPYAVVGAAGFLALAFWLAYRRPSECDHGRCAPPNRRALRRLVWIAAVLVGSLSVVALTMQVTLV